MIIHRSNSPMFGNVIIAALVPRHFPQSIANWDKLYKVRKGVQLQWVSSEMCAWLFFNSAIIEFLIKSSQSQDDQILSVSAVTMKSNLKILQLHVKKHWFVDILWALSTFFWKRRINFMYEEHFYWKISVMSLLGLFDLRARLVGINQVIAVYMKSLNVVQM